MYICIYMVYEYIHRKVKNPPVVYIYSRVYSVYIYIYIHVYIHNIVQSTRGEKKSIQQKMRNHEQRLHKIIISREGKEQKHSLYNVVLDMWFLVPH